MCENTTTEHISAFSFPTIGKKWTLIALSVPFIGGWIVLLFANSYGMLLAGRILTGFSAEIAEAKYRGALGVLMQLMMCFGILFINVNCNTDWKVRQLRKCFVYKTLQ
jgi:hypothetical protein